MKKTMLLLILLIVLFSIAFFSWNNRDVLPTQDPFFYLEYIQADLIGVDEELAYDKHSENACSYNVYLESNPSVNRVFNICDIDDMTTGRATLEQEEEYRQAITSFSLSIKLYPSINEIVSSHLPNNVNYNFSISLQDEMFLHNSNQLFSIADNEVEKYLTTFHTGRLALHLLIDSKSLTDDLNLYILNQDISKDCIEYFSCIENLVVLAYTAKTDFFDDYLPQDISHLSNEKENEYYNSTVRTRVTSFD